MAVPRIVVKQDEDGQYCARLEGVPGARLCGHGETREAALTDVREGVEAWLEILIELALAGLS